MGGKPKVKGPSDAEQREKAQQSWANYTKWQKDTQGRYDRASASVRARAGAAGSTGATAAIQKKLDADFRRDMADIEGGATAQYLRDYHGKQQQKAQKKLDQEYAEAEEEFYDKPTDMIEVKGPDGEYVEKAFHRVYNEETDDYDHVEAVAPTRKKADIGDMTSYFSKEFGEGKATQRPEDTKEGKAKARAKASGSGRASAAKQAQAEGSAWSVSKGSRTESPWT